MLDNLKKEIIIFLNNNGYTFPESTEIKFDPIQEKFIAEYSSIYDFSSNSPFNNLNNKEYLYELAYAISNKYYISCNILNGDCSKCKRYKECWNS